MNSLNPLPSLPDMISSTLEAQPESTPRLTLPRLREALYNGEASHKEDLDVLRDMASRKDEVLRMIEANPGITREFNDPKELRRQFDALHDRYRGEIHHIAASRDFQERTQKKGIFRRVLSSIGGFVKKHPIMSLLIGAGIVAGGVAGGFYLTGNWELLMTMVGASKIGKVAEAVRELAPITPETPPLPGGGIYDVPPPLPGPGEFPDVPF